MDGVSDEATFVVTSLERLAMSNPFGDAECASVELGKVVDVTQLADEISAAVGFTVMVAQVTTQSGGSKLYVCPVVSETVIMTAVRDHEMDDLYGMNMLQRKRHELMQKLSSGDELSNEEFREALTLALSE